ncbi:Epoxide hydrolase A [Psilocybe cubensis]|uniref:Epoxide hydrolase A n=2 Tax=Psilocybe cubensis TaxID=181762 RepID=A0ACB8H1C5_PSICU|nr:Epoxide hydrolase A [Psilocybe cubensis]KAH9481286.1 Epoxide hydrolase A [Psilocybe cubensis]
MDPALYKDVVVPRGFKYHYYYSPAAEGKPTLLLLHGFPATSYDWRRQIAYFQPKGYGILAPDSLGSGGSSTPLDVNAFLMNEAAGDIIHILDTENLDKVVGFGHDWGSILLSRLSLLHSDRFIGFVWMGLSFLPPSTQAFDLEAGMQFAKSLVGYEAYAYWQFFISEKAPELIEKNIESFSQLLYPKESPACWLEWITVRGKTEEWMVNNKQPGRPSWLSDEEFDRLNSDVLKSGIRSSLNWYKAQVGNIDLEDNKKIPVENYKLKSPSFLAASMRDPVSVPSMSIAILGQHCDQVKTVEFDAGHWVHVERSEEVNKAVEEWLADLPKA